jgi:hypothetical protein
MFVCSISTYDKQGNPGDKIEHYPQYLVERNKQVEQCVERIPGDMEQSTVYRVDPISDKDINQGRANQHRSVNNRTPQKNVRTVMRAIMFLLFPACC